MKNPLRRPLSSIAFALSLILSLTMVAQEPEYHSIFDGKSLSGWAGDTDYWRVEEGCIVGESTADRPLDQNTFLRWTEGELDDFELVLEFRIEGTDRANSGIQIRSQRLDDGAVSGYQADIDRSGTYLGILYDEHTGRGILANRGQRVTIDADGQREVETIGDPQERITHFRRDDWNEYRVRATGNRIMTMINGEVMADLIDNQTGHVDDQGLLALQLHAGPPMKIAFRNIRLARLRLSGDRKKVVFVAGCPSHGWGAHEHNAGCLLLASRLDEAAARGLPIVSTVYQNGWPNDPTAFDNADSVVFYCDGGKGHLLHQHGDEFESVMRRGAGLVCLHYAVEVPKGESGQRFLQWIGGYFETDWSVNPHWKARFTQFPDHPITRGVEPFEMLDEWYYHMRFPAEMAGVQPILTALPPAESLRRPDGPHSGNPAVRTEVLKEKRPQHVAWAFERSDGTGRGFGFTGGHFHRNWKSDPFRKLVLNAIAWTAHLQIPADGISSSTPTDKELDANQDEPKPAGK